jgi:hypothetical protein
VIGICIKTLPGPDHTPRGVFAEEFSAQRLLTEIGLYGHMTMVILP